MSLNFRQLVCLALMACSNTGTRTAAADEAGAGETERVSRETGFQSSEGRHTGRVTNPTSEIEMAVVVDMPEGDGPWPVLFVVPGGNLSGERALPSSQRVTWVEAGFAVVIWDPDGRGESGGEEDRGGHIHQDGLKAVIDVVSRLPKMDTDRMGLVSLSYGVVMATGMLSRHSVPVRFLVDWEGPANRWDIRDCASHAGNKPDPDGVVKKVSCEDEDFWQQREAERFVSQLQVPYHRIQARQDHAQSDTEHNTRMIEAAVGGGVVEVWLNEQRIRSASDSFVLGSKGPRSVAILRAARQQMESTTGEPVVSGVAPQHLQDAKTEPPGRSKGPPGRKGSSRN